MKNIQPLHKVKFTIDALYIFFILRRKYIYNIMTTWKTVDLTKFNAVPLNELIPDKIYIMYGYREFWPQSRWVVKFKQLLENGDIAKLDVLNVKFQYGETSADDLSKNKIISTMPFIFYDYDDVFTPFLI